MAEGPLSGIRVLDLTRLIPGPYCSLVLSDLGADVVKVEDPEAGDYLREVSPRMFAALNRGKRSIALDLKSDPEPLRTLCAAADVLVEGFRPGVLERLAPFVLQDFPRLVVCRISGFGQTGPRRDRAGHGIGYLALSGALAGAGAVPGVQIADLAGGFTAVSAILAALLERMRSGRGRTLDLSMTAATTQYILAAEEPNILDVTRPCYRAYLCRGGGRYVLGALETKFWERFCRAIGAEELISNADYADSKLRSANRDRLNAAIAAKLRTENSDAWVKRLNDAGVPCGHIYSIDQVFSDPQVQHLNPQAAIESPHVGKLTLLRQPMTLSRTPSRMELYPPEAGEHTEEVLREAGFAPDEIKELRRDGII